MRASEALGEPEIRPRRILPVIVASQFAGTSLWFAGNAVLGDLERDWGLAPAAVGHATSAVQAGFIAGTLLFAILAISDRYSPRKVFFVCSLLGAASNAGLYFAEGLSTLLASRFLSGFFLAGIYPVGMRIAAGWYRSDLGRAIGLLVGALVLGTAFPHLLKGLGHALPWNTVTLAVSLIAAVGGVLMLWLVPDGPYLATGAKFDPRALVVIFQSRDFRASAFGYFGHMWELYAFWAFVPAALALHLAHAGGMLNVPLLGVLDHRGGRARMRGRRPPFAEDGQRTRRGGATPRLGNLLRRLAALVQCANAALSRVHAAVGRHGGRRFAAVLDAERAVRAARARRIGIDDRKLHRLRDHHCEHSTAERFRGSPRRGTFSAARAGAGVRPGRHAAALAPALLVEPYACRLDDFPPARDLAANELPVCSGVDDIGSAP